jgi:hypothetical protein
LDSLLLEVQEKVNFDEDAKQSDNIHSSYDWQEVKKVLKVAKYIIRAKNASSEVDPLSLKAKSSRGWARRKLKTAARYDDSTSDKLSRRSRQSSH